MTSPTTMTDVFAPLPTLRIACERCDRPVSVTTPAFAAEREITVSARREACDHGTIYRLATIPAPQFTVECGPGLPPGGYERVSTS